ncbi:MAG: hypothetical protein IJV77_05730 [Clostridia bacterium]|nr:hypothetical protein [Clostridia bacterium]
MPADVAGTCFAQNKRFAKTSKPLHKNQLTFMVCLPLEQALAAGDKTTKKPSQFAMALINLSLSE